MNALLLLRVKYAQDILYIHCKCFTNFALKSILTLAFKFNCLIYRTFITSICFTMLSINCNRTCLKKKYLPKKIIYLNFQYILTLITA